MDTLAIVFLVIAILAIIAAVFAFVWPIIKKNGAENKASKIVSDANVKAEQILANAKLEGRSEVDQMRKVAQEDIDERKKVVIASETKLDNREAALDKREDAIITRETQIDEKRNEYEQRLQALDVKDKDLQAKIDSIIVELQKVANMSLEQAKDELMARVEEKEAKRIALYKEQMEEEAQSQAEDKAKTLMALAMEKYAQDVTCERNSSAVALPSDEMKGRIIGREGRNIKSMEQLFGVSLIIDDTPETLTVSCFDPIRREKAKLTLEALIRDGRIQPGRIEDLYQKISDEFDESLRRIGEQTVFKLGLPRISSGLLMYIGRLKYRTSYGQNVLDHSIQVAYLSSVMASELGLDPVLAKRAGLLHDIGKSIDAEQEGSHVQLGSMLAKKFNEPDTVINAIESHHGDVPKKYLISELVTAADTLSAARPGARSETLETYIKRLEQLETICKSFDGVHSSYALQSGRDVRVMVVPDKISDEDAKVMAVQIREKIESEMQYPGQIKVSVIRETRAVEIAK
ncbi:MAG: ribonuclease Y [Bacilli bacterium]|jgi:ribonuclease Y|nr:ribonuclease Y [Bacilli bacterium]